eukprot:CAMPEP_0172155572 /NCGR_PEP_ID=MMETSP1050-20130122/2708_1 /TAXON_ID=233186 /ORGANISM="Cryptomonas curvata, Strain CCAP979/52" /LENGTH=70 /DNA_ID=CAMNT_0012824501 /DNA_START=325 /DNA_END=533 /DNA_ORIENTATION=+
MLSDKIDFDEVYEVEDLLPAADPGITEVPEEDSFVCPGQPANKAPPPKKKLQDWLQSDSAAIAAARMIQV